MPGDLVEIYAPLSRYHGYFALIISGPSSHGTYLIFIQESMTKRTFSFSELERIN